MTGTVYPHNPKPTDIAAIVEQAKDHDVIVLGTVTATHGQVDLAQTLLRLGKPMVTLALRTPFDLAAYPRSATHAHGSHRPSLDALTSALFGDIPFRGPARGHPRPLRTGARDRDMTEPHGTTGFLDIQINGGSRLHGRPIEHLGSGTSSSRDRCHRSYPPFSAPYEHVDAAIEVIGHGPPEGYEGADPRSPHRRAMDLPGMEGCSQPRSPPTPRHGCRPPWAESRAVRMVTSPPNWTAPSKPGSSPTPAWWSRLGTVGLTSRPRPALLPVRGRP